MYNVYNYSNVFYLWDRLKQQTFLIGDENKLIDEIAQYFQAHWSYHYNDTKDIRERHSNELITESTVSFQNEPHKRYLVYDGYFRCISLGDYDDIAFKLYLQKYKDKRRKVYWRKSYIEHRRFRYDPIPYTSSRGGGSPIRPRKIKHLKQMYANPEYKQFNRGSHKNVPDGWWDDWYRNVERSWKKHRKHQWKEKVSVM